MRISEFLKLRLPERKAVNDVADIEDLTFDMEKLDAEALRQKLIDDNLQRDKVDNTAFNAHKAKPILDHLDNSVTDAKIGERSIGTSKGMLQALLDAIGNAIKAITGNATWSELPAVTLSETKLHIDSKENPHSTTAEQVGTYTKAAIDAKDKAINDAATAHYNDTDRHINSGERPKWNDKYTKSEVDNKFSMLETNTDWKESVATFADIAKAYPTPQDGWTVNTRDTDYTYRYSGTNWVVISANAIPKATTSVDGLQTKENVADVNANTANRHNHNNKAVLDTITNVLINKWNTVTEKLNLSGGTLTGDLILNAAPTTNLQAATKKYVDDIASGKGNGDMLKTVYDKNNDGIVDNSEKVNGLTVLSAVPSGAKFTDTIYTHPNTHPYSIITGAPAALPPIGAAGGDLSGSYPNPTVKNDSHTHDTQYYTKGQINASVTPANGYARSNLGNPSITEMALIDAEATNKLWFYNPDYLLFEQTTDGTNWTTVSISNEQKKAFVSGNSNASIAIPRNAVKYRITVTNNGGYVYLNWLYIYMSTCGNNCAFLLERKPYGSEVWNMVFSETNDVNTWPGYVFISHATIPFHPEMHSDKVRLTFIPTWNSGNTNAITLHGMEWWGGFPSGKRTIYGWDSDKNVTFPANVTAASFIGNSSTSTKLLTPRSINGVNFDGTANITVSMDGGTY